MTRGFCNKSALNTLSFLWFCFIFLFSSPPHRKPHFLHFTLLLRLFPPPAPTLSKFCSIHAKRLSFCSQISPPPPPQPPTPPPVIGDIRSTVLFFPFNIFFSSFPNKIAQCLRSCLRFPWTRGAARGRALSLPRTGTSSPWGRREKDHGPRFPVPRPSSRAAPAGVPSANLKRIIRSNLCPEMPGTLREKKGEGCGGKRSGLAGSRFSLPEPPAPST